MRSAPREQIGLSLGAWGAVQATSAGLAIAVGGVVRDAIVATEAVGASASTPYTSVFMIEVGLLTLGLLFALPLRGKDAGRSVDDNTAETSYLSAVAERQGTQQPFAGGRTS